ncbi:ABC transporter permease [Deinococcus detaillensis]|uniref:ABC transporter permease n=1 Tax=Deinococcus detaillensis TaxID=2592048 RepID=UPI001CDCA1BD|nr:ABC transporter permease [Deinococcus detaillensis]
MNVDASALPRQQLKTRSASAAAWRRFRRQPGAVAGLLITALLIAICIFAPWLAPHDPVTQYPNGLSELGAPLPPTHTFWFGTDALGRDLYSRLIFGTRTSLLVAVLSNLIATSIALVLGTLAGYFGGLTDTLIMRLTDVLISFPVLLLAAFLAAVLRPGIGVIIGVIGGVGWFYLARVIRAELLSVRRREYVEAARALGASDARIIFRHALPQILGQVMVYSTLNFSTTVLFVAALSYVGIGVQPPTPDWGNMIADGSQYLTVSPWLVIFPGIFLGLSVLSFNLLGDGLRDALDVKSGKKAI